MSCSFFQGHNTSFYKRENRQLISFLYRREKKILQGQQENDENTIHYLFVGSP